MHAAGALTPGASPGFTVTKTWYVVRAACAAQAAARPRPAEAGYRTAPGQGRFTGQGPSREFTRAQTPGRRPGVHGDQDGYVVRAESGCTLRMANPGRKPGVHGDQDRVCGPRGVRGSSRGSASPR